MPIVISNPVNKPFLSNNWGNSKRHSKASTYNLFFWISSCSFSRIFSFSFNFFNSAFSAFVRSPNNVGPSSIITFPLSFASFSLNWLLSSVLNARLIPSIVWRKSSFVWWLEVLVYSLTSSLYLASVIFSFSFLPLLYSTNTFSIGASIG